MNSEEKDSKEEVILMRSDVTRGAFHTSENVVALLPLEWVSLVDFMNSAIDNKETAF